MSLRKTIAVLLALLLAGMVVVPMVSAEDHSGVVITPSSEENDKSNNAVVLQKLPSFQPGINDKLTYDEKKQLMKNYTPSPSMSESEIAQIIFSKDWFSQNSKKTELDMVEVTFPTKWLDAPEIRSDEAIVMLRIPKKMLELDDMNSNLDMITVSYSEKMFEEFSTLDEKNKTLQERQNTAEARLSQPRDTAGTTIVGPVKTAGTKSINRQVRAFYQRDTGYSVTKVIGMMDPTSYSNSGETFVNYNEREIYLDRSGDSIEFIMDFTDSGNTYAWVAVFDEETWSTAWTWLNIDVTGTLQQVNYHFYITNGVYDLWLQDSSTGTWYYNSYSDTDNPSVRVDWLVGSTEVDTVGGISNYFKTETNPIRDDYTYSNNNWYSPQTTFDWDGFTSDEQYVYASAWFDGSGRINTQHIAGQNY